MNSGVYCISFGGDSKYIGSSVDLGKRLSDHLIRLRKGTSNCIKLQRAYNKYGEGSLVYAVLEHCTENIREREEFYIRLYNSVAEGYNVSYDTKAPMTGRSHSESTKRLMSEKAKGNRGRRGQKLSKDHIELMKVDRIGKLVGVSINVGEANGGSKLTKIQAMEIYNLKGSASQSSIAKLYGVAQTTVFKIHNKLKWKSIHNE